MGGHGGSDPIRVINEFCTRESLSETIHRAEYRFRRGIHEIIEVDLRFRF
jgi:hypothetical protein